MLVQTDTLRMHNAYVQCLYIFLATGGPMVSLLSLMHANEDLSYGQEPQYSVQSFRLQDIVYDVERNRNPHAFLMVL